MAQTFLNLAQGVTGTLPTGNYVQGGITEADQWRITSDHSFSGSYFITANWERDDFNFSKIGTGLSESSGVFSFGNTGIYHIQANFFYQPSGNDLTYAGGEIFLTSDNSSYNADTEGYAFIHNGMSGDTEHANITISTIFDVTNVSTHKFKIRGTVSNTATIKGHSTVNKSYFTVFRLGDT